MVFANRIYANDGNCFSFDASVIECFPVSENLFRLTLDRTAFFPGGGGQKADEGTIRLPDGTVLPLLSLEEKANEIFHYVAADVPEGTRIHGEIDQAVRFPRMQNHSGEHILSGLIHEAYGFDNVGFHMGEDGVTLDLSGELSPEMILSIEQKANEIIFENRPVTIEYPSADELKQLEYRSKKELTGEVRIVRIDGVDCCACCAPHVARTGEIGSVKIIGSMRCKGGTRLTVVCGREALAYYQASFETEQKLVALLSAPRAKLFEAVARLKEENEENQFKLRQLFYEQLKQEAQRIDPVNGVIVFFSEKADMDALRVFINSAVEHCRLAVALSPAAEGFHYAMTSNTEAVDVIAKQANQALQGRGGGRNGLAMGSFGASQDQIVQYFHSIFY